MKNNKLTTLKKIGLTLLVEGLLLMIIPTLVICFRASIVLGIIALGIIATLAGAIILLRE